MQLTSAMANKLIKQIREENQKIFYAEQKDSKTTYIAGEEPIPSDYSFVATQNLLWENNHKIRILRHAINRFNMETKLKTLGITIDQALVYMAMLTDDKTRLDRLRQAKPLERRTGMGGVSEYTKRNYDAADVEAAYKSISDTLRTLQLELDEVNLTIPFDVDIDMGA